MPKNPVAPPIDITNPSFPGSWVGKTIKIKLDSQLAWLVIAAGDLRYNCTADKGTTIQINNVPNDYPKDCFFLV